MLDDETIPIRNPKSSIGSNLCKYRRNPFVGTRQEIKCLLVIKIRSSFNGSVLMYHMARWLRNEGNLIPIFFRKSPGGIKIMTSSCGITSKNIHLTHFFSDRLHVFMGVYILTSIQAKWSIPDVTMGNRHVPTVRIVGRRPKHISRLIKIKTPSIIRSRCHMFHFGTIGFKSEKSLSKLQRISAHFSLIS